MTSRKAKLEQIEIALAKARRLIAEVEAEDSGQGRRRDSYRVMLNPDGTYPKSYPKHEHVFKHGMHYATCQICGKTAGMVAVEESDLSFIRKLDKA